jgi:hypothetical protein
MAAIKGKKLSAEHKAKIAEAAKGKKHSEVTIKKMSDAALRLQKEQLEEQQVHVMLKVVEAMPKEAQSRFWDIHTPDSAHLFWCRMLLREAFTGDQGWYNLLTYILRSHQDLYIPPEVQEFLARAELEEKILQDEQEALLKDAS